MILNNKIFDKIFKDYFPSLGDNECKNKSKKIKNDENAYYRKCLTQIYNIGYCPILIAINKLLSNFKIKVRIL